MEGWETIGKDKDRVNLFMFDEDGKQFTGKFIRLWAPGEHEFLNKGFIEFEAEGGERWALPALEYLWETLQDEPAGHTYRITRVRKVPTKAGKTFVVMTIQRKV